MKVLAKYLNPRVISRVGAYGIDPKGIVEGNIAGAHKSPFHGFSVEFAGHREYMPGDDPKHIDWNVYYKRDKYFCKQYEAETNLISQIFLDASESMRFQSGDLSKLDYAAYLAVSLTYLVTSARDSVGIGVFNDKIVDYLPPSNSMQAVYKISELIEKREPAKKTAMGTSLMDFAQRIGRRQIVVVISDCLLEPDELNDGLSRLRYDHHELVLFHVADPMELDFDLKGMVKFKGMENKGDIKLDAQRVRKAYKEKFKAHKRSIMEVCEKNRCEYVPANTGLPLEELLMSYLSSRMTHINR
ncbi:DUF58 domain-containing protein [Lentisphaera profundi]|uniref:DUF58 domain-containing protein n=1 Tax=Lentisphaera profundi TaxID=1658616 RepID=A0ABY7VS16_9BACT|nr:DUF58 domain-containing protein [Lentisphaera profundi]WDE96529.1 DUF58 domain-containing protein [Lentisphaera profundi]